ncbi:MAG: hypothetical protein H0T92_02790 [Pyrinomonadaceae bacterium]|nr:hypothetical protein [Pyrinomonadaceae bacterium]
MSAHHGRPRQILLLVICLTLLAPITVSAKDSEFDAVVKQLKTQYRAKRKSIPFLGLANFAVKIVRPAGVKSFKLAIFEDQDFSDKPGVTQLSTVVRGALTPAWHPLVRVYSPRDGEQTYVYLREAGKNVKLLIVNVEPREAVVVQVKVNLQTLIKWMQKPERIGKQVMSQSDGTAQN